MSICEAETTTFAGVNLECEGDPDHPGPHLDIDQGIYWIDADDTDRLARLGIRAP